MATTTTVSNGFKPIIDQTSNHFNDGIGESEGSEGSSTTMIDESGSQQIHSKADDYKRLLKSCGNTPLVPIQKLLIPHKFVCKIHAKCEFKNPSGSIWDRFVVHKIHEARTGGYMEKHFVTGGNEELCKSLAWAGATGDLSVTVLPDEIKHESQSLILKSLGSNVILSFCQDPLKTRTMSCLKNHIKQLQDTSGIPHYLVLPTTENKTSDTGLFDDITNEVLSQIVTTVTDESDSPKKLDFDLVVCSGTNKFLMNGIFQSLHSKSKKDPIFVATKTNFEEIIDDQGEFTEELKVNWEVVSESEAYDMVRRLIREEGLLVGLDSGAVMSATLKAIEKYGFGSNKNVKVLSILPDSLSSSSADFLSTEWMVQKGHYNPAHLESLYWWYEMAVENVSPPVSLIVTAGTPVRAVWKAMIVGLKAERAVVMSHDNHVIGVVTYENLIALMNSANEEVPVEDVCYKQFGVIDSKASFPELEVLLRKYYWVINVHHMNYYDSKPESPQNSEEVIGAVNLADFMKYKRKVEAHHLTEFGISMSDGIPSDIWLEKFQGLRK